MAQISHLEKRFKEQTQKEQENIIRINRTVFQEIEKDWREQLNTSKNTLHQDILSHSQQVLDGMKQDRRRVREIYKHLIWLAGIALSLWVLVALAWFFLFKEMMSPNPYKNLQLEVCGKAGVTVCAIGTPVKENNSGTIVMIEIHPKN